jgi:hypothetical protein
MHPNRKNYIKNDSTDPSIGIEYTRTFEVHYNGSQEGNSPTGEVGLVDMDIESAKSKAMAGSVKEVV